MSEYTITAEQFFAKASIEVLNRWIAQYEKLIAIENDRYDPGVDLLTGKSRRYPPKAPWMYKHWMRGLDLAKSELQKRNHLKTEI